MIHLCFNTMQKLLLVSIILFSVWLSVSVSAQNELTSVLNSESSSSINEEVEALKKAALNLNRDLILLEEELLFPGNTQVAVFVSMDIGEFFQLDAVKVKLDNRIVASHLYTERQVDALFRGGMQRIYLGNVRSGQHEISAFFTGKGPEGRDYKRAAKLNFIKTNDPAMLELRIVDSTQKLQPVFDIKEWELP
jgi:hypothetical protein